MARVLNFLSASFKSICSHCFCPVVEPSDMNWKLVKDNQCLQWKTPTIQTLFYLLRSNWKWVYFSECWFYNAKCEKVFKSCPKMYFERKQKNWPAASQRKPFFHRRHLPKRSWQDRTWLKLIFLEEDCSFFSFRYYSWEVGKERRKLTFMGSTCCLAQSLHRPFLPSEVHYLLKVWGVLQFR